MSKRYTIGEKEFEVPELCIAQDQALVQLLTECGVTDLANIDVARLLRAVGEQKKLQRFFALILVPVNAEFDEAKIDEIELLAAKMKNTTAFEVAEDFFDKNRAFWSKLDGYFRQIMTMLESKLGEMEKVLSRFISPTIPPLSSKSLKVS